MLRPRSLKQGIFGTLTWSDGGLGKSPPGGGPGTTFQSAIGGEFPGGLMIGITVALEEPGGVVVIH